MSLSFNTLELAESKACAGRMALLSSISRCEHISNQAAGSYQSTKQRTAGGWQLCPLRHFILHHTKVMLENGSLDHLWGKQGHPSIHLPASCSSLLRAWFVPSPERATSLHLTHPDFCDCGHLQWVPFPTTHYGDAVLGSRPAAGQHAQGHSHCRSGNKSAVREIQKVSKSPRFLSKRHDGVMMFNGIQSTLPASGRLFRARQPSLGIKTVVGCSNPWNNWSGPTASSFAATSFDRRTISTSSCPKVCARSGLTSLWSRMVLKAKVV